MLPTVVVMMTMMMLFTNEKALPATHLKLFPFHPVVVVVVTISLSHSTIITIL